jgi:hypothetical protein
MISTETANPTSESAICQFVYLITMEEISTATVEIESVIESVALALITEELMVLPIFK